MSPRVAGGAVGQVRRDRPPVWSGRGVGGRAEHVRVCPRLVGGAPAGRGGSRCVAVPPSSGRPSGGASPLLAQPRCRSAGAVRRGREHAARTAGRARPRGARVGTRRRRGERGIGPGGVAGSPPAEPRRTGGGCGGDVGVAIDIDVDVSIGEGCGRGSGTQQSAGAGAEAGAGGGHDTRSYRLEYGTEYRMEYGIEHRTE